ncbi:MAG: Rrf2 family transcriptional regulator [Elusimicrobia bacterium]|nr:Rrf2 family transcriptional regulator [Elusimicrobiota bacterium]
MRITSSVEYATRLMLTLAREHGRAPVAAERLAESDAIPADYVSQLLVKLRRAGLVVSHRGSAGGYSLSEAPGKITLARVVRAVDDVVFEDVCARYADGPKDCRHQGACALSPVWSGLGSVLTRYLEGITLADVLSGAPAACGTPVWLEKLSSS